MAKTQLRLVIEGLPADNGLVRATGFTNSLNTVLNSIKKSDRIVSGKKSSFYLRISELSYKSPATVLLEAVPWEPEYDYREPAFNKAYSTYQYLREGLPSKSKIDNGLIEDVIELTSQIGTAVRSVTLAFNGNVVVVDNEFKRIMSQALVPEEFFRGYVRGMLEYINIHQGKNVFRIYPDVGPIKISCHFSDNLVTEAIAAVGKYIEVRGELIYKSISQDPHKIAVEELIVLPSDNMLPSLRDLRGLIPNITGSLTSEEFVRKIRNAQAS
ncbi:MAG: hypothetical protein PHE62_12105 [Acidobacteriota bacterium]|nr:hypothetical protein [Acidobacteriota bacterium]